jgi:uncharacterized protein YdaU (DUF1376 family)
LGLPIPKQAKAMQVVAGSRKTRSAARSELESFWAPLGKKLRETERKKMLEEWQAQHKSWIQTAKAAVSTGTANQTR